MTNTSIVALRFRAAPSFRVEEVPPIQSLEALGDHLSPRLFEQIRGHIE
jgi:hypothetical protein